MKGDCAICGCLEEEHDPEDGECTGCGEECSFEESEEDEDEDDVDEEDEDDFDVEDILDEDDDY